MIVGLACILQYCGAATAALPSWKLLVYSPLQRSDQIVCMPTLLTLSEV